MHSAALIEELNDAVARGTHQQRAGILSRIADLFVAGSASYSDDQIELFDDVLVRLAGTIELSARASLSRLLARDPRAPLKISCLLALDDDIAVAGPVLEQSRRLDNETLLATARTKGQQHLLAIAKRTALDEALTDVLVERGDRSVVLSAAGNPGARFSDNGYTALTMRSQDDDELAACVGLRRDIPRHHLLRLMVVASHAVRIKLEAANPSMANLIQEAVSQAAASVLDHTSALSRDYAAARQHIESLRAAGALDEQHVAGFAAANEFEETTAALAALCGLSLDAVDRAMTQDTPDAVLVIAKAIGMSADTVKAILRMHAGPRGISPGELDQCLGTFARLTPATARQVIKFRDNRSRGARFTRAQA